MKLIGLLAITLIGAACLTGCMAPNAPIAGMVILDHAGPVAIGDLTATAEKTGTAVAVGYAGYVTGDVSIAAAMKNGEITKIHHVDCKIFSILGLYTTYETIVYGE